MSIDENGTPDLKGIRKKLDRGQEISKYDVYFTVTGVILGRSDFPDFKKSIVSLKHDFWPNGQHNYRGQARPVCFHSRDIRKKQGPFASPHLNYGDFIKELSKFLARVPATLMSASVDKKHLVETYYWPHHPYEWSLVLIVERYARWLQRQNKTGVLLLESRGSKEDKEILASLVSLFEHGTQFVEAERFQVIRGVYFNPKWGMRPDGVLGSYVSLELADLYSYPIHQRVRDGHSNNRAFEALQPKIYGYPNYNGRGLKVFP